MAGADDGDDSGLHVGSPVSDAEVQPAATDNSVTQLLPVVPTDPPRGAGDTPVVRAVARRAAAALPALGAATRRGVPRSARATVDRSQPAGTPSTVEPGPAAAIE